MRQELVKIAHEIETKTEKFRKFQAKNDRTQAHPEI